MTNGYGTGAFDLVGRKPLAQTFQQISTGELFTAVVNHFKSKGSSSGGVGDADAGDGQGLSNGTRTRQAQDLAAWLATKPTGTNDADYLLLGDFNAYAQEDPITTLASAGYGNLLPNTSYSYVFDGQVGALDHALGSNSLATQVTGAEKWHINADEPTVLDYNTEFKSAGQIISLYNADQFRASDHDPVLVGLNLNSAPSNVTLSATSTNENVTANSLVGTFSTTDPTIGDTFTYSFVPGTNDNVAFTISGNQLQINASPDFETKSSYNILVRTTDNGGLTFDKALTINVNDLNEIFGTTGNNNLVGTANNDYIDGKAGNDTLNGGAGNDTLVGGTGNDTYKFVITTTSLGADTITESVGDGQDTIDLTGTTAVIRLNLGITTAQTLVANGSKLTLTAANAIENVIAGAGADRIIGNDLDNRLVGGAGNDALTGGAGNDTLVGGAGNDILTGGTGNDFFGFEGNAAFTVASQGLDTIQDFTPGNDQISLSKSVFAFLTSVVGQGFSVASEFAVVEDDDLAGTSNGLIVYSSSSGSLFYNQNSTDAGFGTGGEFAILATAPTLTANNFSLV
jgi:Ca2+-binding RTX toxin-like protein